MSNTIWLTGASSGIGLALCEKLLQQGYHVLASVRSTEKMQPLQKQFPNALHVVYADVTKTDDLKNVKQAIESLGGLHGLILAAGVCEYFDNGQIDNKALERIFAVNFFAATACCEMALPLLQHSKNQKPFILGLCSQSTVVPFTRAEAYGASKAALQYFLESLRIDQHENMDICIVQPGFVKTPLTDNNDFPMPFIQTADKAADEIMKAVKKRPLKHAFPKRLYYGLKLLGLSKTLWFKKIGISLRQH